MRLYFINSNVEHKIVSKTNNDIFIHLDNDFYLLNRKNDLWNPKSKGTKGGHAVCCHPDTGVITKDGVKKISDIGPSDLVLTRRGYEEIKHKIINSCEDSLIYIYSGLYPEPLKVTKEHPILSSDVGRWHKWSMPLSLSYRDASEVKAGDVVCSVVDDTIEDIQDLSLDFCRLLGYYIGDGNIQIAYSKNMNIKSAKFRLTYSRFNKKKIEKDLLRIVAQEYPKVKHSIYEHKKSNTNILTFYSTELAKKILHYCGGANEKRMHKSLLYLPLIKQLEILKGWHLTDGNSPFLSKNCSIACNSLELVNSMITLLQRNRLTYSFHINPGGLRAFHNGVFNCKKVYIIRLNNIKYKSQTRYEGNLVLKKVQKVKGNRR
jgi:hypothetical protein